MGGYRSVLVGSVSVCHFKINEQTYSRPRLRESTYHLGHIPCWDAECEPLYKTILESPKGNNSSLAATALLAKLDRKRRDCWSEAVWSIDFSHSSQKAWNILNNLTGRSRHSPRHCPVSADAIASQLVRNGKYEAVDCKSSRLVFQKVSDVWRDTTPDPVISLTQFFTERIYCRPSTFKTR